MLIPWVHYVPLAADGSDADRIIDFLEAHPAEAEIIAENGRQFVPPPGNVYAIQLLQFAPLLGCVMTCALPGAGTAAIEDGGCAALLG